MKMFETTKVILISNSRNLFKKMKASPILYSFFTIMTLLSLIIIALSTKFLLSAETDITLEEVFFAVFLVFLMKSANDFHTHFVKSPELSYPFSTQVDQKKTTFEVFVGIFLIEIFIWFSFSILFLFFLSVYRVNVWYPVEYFLFTIGIFSSVVLGCCAAINFFQDKKYRLAPMLILFGLYLLSKDLFFVVACFPLTLVHLAWSIKNSMLSYGYVPRKKRDKEKSQVKIRKDVFAIFYKEIIILWRDKLLFSFIFTSVTTGLITGYLFLDGARILFPESIREIVGDAMPSMFLFFGVFVVAMYTSVFPSLNLFLNEENTMWVLRNLPVKNDTIVYGKVLAVLVCFIASIPFIPYVAIFVGIDKIPFLIWLLVFSFIAGLIVSLPFGAKYVGKKSDILLLYSVSLILFAITSATASFVTIIAENFRYIFLVYLLILVIELAILPFSIKLSARIIDVYN